MLSRRTRRFVRSALLLTAFLWVLAAVIPVVGGEHVNLILVTVAAIWLAFGVAAIRRAEARSAGDAGDAGDDVPTP